MEAEEAKAEEAAVEAADQAEEAAAGLLAAEPGLELPEKRPLLERVRRLFAEDPDRFN